MMNELTSTAVNILQFTACSFNLNVASALKTHTFIMFYQRHTSWPLSKLWTDDMFVKSSIENDASFLFRVQQLMFTELSPLKSTINCFTASFTYNRPGKDRPSVGDVGEVLHSRHLTRDAGGGASELLFTSGCSASSADRCFWGCCEATSLQWRRMVVGRVTWHFT